MNDNTQAILEETKQMLHNKKYWHERKYHAEFDFDLFLQDLEQILIAQEEENNGIPHECIRCQNLYQDGCDWHCGLKDYAPPNCPVKIPVYPAPPEEGK